MLEKIEQQQQDITAKVQEIGALKEKIDEKEKLFANINFISSLEVMVSQMCEKLNRWGEELENNCKQLGGKVKDQLVELRVEFTWNAGRGRWLKVD